LLQTIAREIKASLQSSSADDALLFDGKQFPVRWEQFISLEQPDSQKAIAFVDGGQAEILSAGNFCLSFLRIAAVVFAGQKKKRPLLSEFYLFTKSIFHENEIWYQSKLFPLDASPLLTSEQLLVSSRDALLATGKERASITVVSSLARRFAELALVRKAVADTDIVVLDGTLEATYPREEALLQQLSPAVCALAKTSALFTKNGHNPTLLLDKLGPSGCWQYAVAESEQMGFVKLHEKSKHVFRYEGKQEHLPFLLEQSRDAVFLGYPYGLILADKLARVSNQEKQRLRMQLLLRKENRELLDAMQATNAHEILDALG